MISLYPKGSSKASSGYLSLYLFDSFKELPQGSQVYIEYVMAILSQANWVKPNRKERSCKYQLLNIQFAKGSFNF